MGQTGPHRSAEISPERFATPRTASLERPAFYALTPGGWRDFVTLLHPPYTFWTLGYVAIGAAAAPQVHLDRVAVAMAIMLLGVGVCAHALDELNGRPLRTQLSDRTLVALAGLSFAGAVAFGISGIIVVSPTLGVFAIGMFLLPAYNLEWFGGRFHTAFWFASIWGVFPALAGWWPNTLAVHDVGQALAGAGAALACFWLAIAQRRLSVPVRELRRRTVSVQGRQRLSDGSERELDTAVLTEPLDGALGALSLAIPLLGAALLAVRL